MSGIGSGSVPLDWSTDATPAGRELERRLNRAAETSWARFGKRITFYLPGMIRSGRERGRYPALSLSGARCELLCDHCRGELLKPMIDASTPDLLHRKALALAKRGAEGFLLTGGSDDLGRVNWEPFLDVISRIREETGLMLSVHSGLLDYATAAALKEAGVSQALVDVVGDENTLERVLHLSNGMGRLLQTLEAIEQAGLEFVPHVVAGMDYGDIRGEHRALEIISGFSPHCLVFVVLFPFANTPMAGVNPPEPFAIAELFAYARELMPGVEQSLGCERLRGQDGYVLETLALAAGINRMAVQSDRAVDGAAELGLEIHYQKTCCSRPLLRRREPHRE
jgi:lipoyl synthase